MVNQAKFKLIFTESLIVGLMVCAVVAGHHYLWWFSSGYQHRQTAQTFFTDVTHGSLPSAYQLTSSGLQANLALADFQDQFKGLDGSHLTVVYQTYASDKTNDIIAGQMTNSKTGHRFIFGMKFAKGTTAIDSMTFVPVTK